MRNTKEINKIRRNNAEIYPIYKMFSWDLLFFYSVKFLFYTITKKITVTEILIINGFYLFFKILMQIPAVTITDLIGKKKSMVLGNILTFVYLLILLIFPGVLSIVIANMVFALGYNMKTIAEANLLYDSVSTKGGDGIYSKLEAKGGSLYYILDGIASLMAGFLFVINNYIPIIICAIFTIISIIMSLKFKDVYPVEKKPSINIFSTLVDYTNDLKAAFKFLLRSKRMKAFILFQLVFCGLVEVIDTYASDLLINIGISEEQFSMIFAVLTLIGGVSLSLKSAIEKIFKNRTLTFLSMSHIFSCIIVGTLASLCNGSKLIIPIILAMCAIQKITVSTWFILEGKYLKNFTEVKSRNKITFMYEFIGGISAGICSILGGMLLKIIKVENAFLIVGLLFLAITIIVLDYMRTRFGLKAEEYSKEDITFE